MPNLPMPEGLTNADLECVMLEVPQLDVQAAYGPDMNMDDLFYGEGPSLQYAQGLVGDKAHVTLLFGIHPSENYVVDVINALDDVNVERILIDHVGKFSNETDGQKYHAIVAHVVPTPSLIVANMRLKELDYTYQYADPFNAHVTLAYIKDTADADEWIRRLGEVYNRTVMPVTGLDLGQED